jgi:RHS repeat-associated protein
MLATKEKPHPGFQLPAAAFQPGFGFAISNTATEFDAPSYENRSGPLCSGYYRDSETGLDYAKARYHQPGMGRFLSADPYMASAGPSDPGSWNRYAYVNGDPVNFMDPTGTTMCNPDNVHCTDPGLGCDPMDPTCGCGPDEFYNPSTGKCEQIPHGPPGSGGSPGGGGSPQLTCSYSAFAGSPSPVPGKYTNGTDDLDGYGLPTQLTFSAQGGTGSYTWTETQTVVRYLTNPNNVITLLNSGTDGPLYWSAGGSTTPPTTSTASVFDAPSTVVFPAGNTITWLFTLQLTVSSGGQTIKCPAVWWNAQISFNSSGGVSGVSWSTTQPTP